MILPWRKSRANKKNKKQILYDDLDVEVMIPTHFRCPISLDLMKDPVTLCTGITYDRESIERWIEAGNETCPVTKQVLNSFDQIPNHILRRMIQDWCVENRSRGVERIPTPRIPVSTYEISAVCSKIVGATQRGDGKTCGELVMKIKNWGKESERNKRCIVENETSCILSACFESFASVSLEKHRNLLGDILSVLSWMFPLGEEGLSKLGSATPLHCIVWFLRNGDLSARQNAVLVLKELLYSNHNQVMKNLEEIEGAVEALVYLIREPVSPTTTKASLTAIYSMIYSSLSSDQINARFLEMGMVGLIVEIIFDAEKSVCEKALGVLDAICNNEQGMAEACKNALIMPLMVKKILRVSDSATELLLSVFWKLCKNAMKKGEENLMIEAIQVGAFQKLLVILQVGCCESRKEKVNELLKLLNVYKNRVDCVDSSMDFKYLKKPF